MGFVTAERVASSCRRLVVLPRRRRRDRRLSFDRDSRKQPERRPFLEPGKNQPCVCQAHVSLDHFVEHSPEVGGDRQIAALVALLREDATLSMPPYTLWLRGPDTIRTWLLGRGAGCRGRRG